MATKQNSSARPSASSTYARKARSTMRTVRREATGQRIAAAGAIAVGAAAFAYLRDPARRESMTRATRDYADRAAAWWRGPDDAEPSASGIYVA